MVQDSLVGKPLYFQIEKASFAIKSVGVESVQLLLESLEILFLTFPPNIHQVGLLTNS